MFLHFPGIFVIFKIICSLVLNLKSHLSTFGENRREMALKKDLYIIMMQ